MTKKLKCLFTLFMLCFCFMLFGGGVSAKSISVDNKIAYVNTSNKSLVLQFADFASSYTCTLTNEDANKTIVNNVSYSQQELPLAGNYTANTRYKLVVKGNNGDELTVYYYTGDAVSGLTADKNSDESLKTTWSVGNGSIYQGYNLRMYDSSSTVIPKITAQAAPGNANTKTIATAQLTNTAYHIYLVGYRTLNGQTYYGQGLSTSYEYVKKPVKVSGLTAVPYANSAQLTWTAVKDATCYTIYKSTKATKGYTVAASDIKDVQYTVTGLTGGKKYYFKVEAVAKAGSKTLVGEQSITASAKIPVVAGKVKRLQLVLDSKKNLALSWDRTSKATGYYIYYKEATALTYTKLGSTKNKIYTLSKLDPNTKYTVMVQAYTKTGGKKYVSSQSSKKLTFTPKTYMDNNANKLIATTVRTMGFVGNRCIYTTKKYSTAVKTAFVNYKGYSSSTKYLVWISHYTQQVSVFEGSKGNWKMIRTFTVATGKATTRSPIGVFKVSYKEPGWFYATTKELYVTHWCGRNSFHTRIKWNGGGYKDATIGKPASHGCIRCYDADAKYIYDNMPRGTTVVSY